jgi:2-methylisocitrate lyase-like PEP mutase family enzyme
VDLQTAAERLRALHHGPETLILPNAWDAATARAVVDAGFPVVATTSAGVAEALGYDDGERTPPDEMFAAIARIARAVDVPVTADIESGYELESEELVQRLLAAGAVGCNLEDTDHSARNLLRPAEEQAQRLAAVKAAAREAGVDIVLNGRTDVFLRAENPADPGLVEEAVRRAQRYLEAGADCIYPIGASSEASIAALVQAIPAPINAIPGFRGAPGLARMRELGVRRLSYAARLYRAARADHERRLRQIALGEEF